jgi:Holliday junction resolvase RusA-like endonuclease
MTWTVTIWGQPPSVNDIYGIVWRYSSAGRRYKGIGKKDTAVKYQDDATLQFKVAKPSNWEPKGFIRLTYRFYLTNDADCDNLKKLLHDALQSATGVNDTWFLTTDQFKLKVPKGQARVEIDIEEDQGSASWALGHFPGPPPSLS